MLPKIEHTAPSSCSSEAHLQSKPDIPIIYQDEHVLAVVKPSGLLSVPGRGPNNQDCAISRIQAHYPEARIVHRLDMATSGLLLIALSAESLKAFSALFQQRNIHKRYQALVHGVIDEQEGKVELPLICDWPQRPKQKICFSEGKPALTHYSVLQQYPNGHQTLFGNHQACTRVELRPVTGRSHQLRVHMMALEHAIIGDEFYAPEALRAQSSRLLLHACELEFTHPFTGEPIKLLSECPF